MGFKIGDIEIKGRVIPAPLAGYTNSAYRKLLKRFHAAYTVSEMISDYALIYKNKETLKMIQIEEDEHPVALQLFGGSKASLLMGLKVLEESSNYDILDINLGCPVNKVVKGKAGSSWLVKGRENELYETIKAICEMSSKPVTVKIRLGWTHEEINCVEIAKLLEKAGVKLIALHCRTRSDFYDGKALYEYARLVKEAISIPFIVNGDIDSPEKAKEVLEYTKADGVMIGRAALGNPYLIERIDTYLETGELLPEASYEMQKELCIKHYNMLKELKDEYIAIREMRSIAPLYFKGVPHSKDCRVAFTKAKNEKEFFEALEFLKD